MFESKLCHPKMSPFGLKIHLILRNIRFRKSFFFVVALQSLGRVQLEIPWSAARQLLCPPLSPLVCSKFISIESVMPSHPVPPPSPFAFSVSQHQGLFQWTSSLHLFTSPLAAKKCLYLFFGWAGYLLLFVGFLVAAGSGGGERGATPPCSALAPRCTGFSFCRKQAWLRWVMEAGQKNERRSYHLRFFEANS